MSDIFTDKCINIIKKNTPEVAIKKISSLNNICDDRKLGNDKALKIYMLYCNEKTDYDSKKYANNLDSYQTKINNNISKAKKNVNKTG